jgi:hypothetical protein
MQCKHNTLASPVCNYPLLLIDPQRDPHPYVLSISAVVCSLANRFKPASHSVHYSLRVNKFALDIIGVAELYGG